MLPIGIMQGRLVPPEDGRFQSFPRASWQFEFQSAADAGLDRIEWIYDQYGADVNPLATDAGINSMKSLSAQTGVHVLSACADYFMDHPLVRASAGELAQRLEKLRWLLTHCQRAGITRVTLPFVDASKIADDADFAQVIAAIGSILGDAQRANVEIHLETSLSPRRFAELLDRLDHPLVKVNYDSGNSSSLGYDVREEFSAYGPRVGSVHIKDRILGGGTVPLGTGNADLNALFESLGRVGYDRDLILQVARSVPGDEVRWASENRAWVTSRWPRVGAEGSSRKPI